MNEKQGVIYTRVSSQKQVTQGSGLESQHAACLAYAKENNMILITRDTESGQACEENDLPCVLLDNDEIFKIVIEKLKSF